MNWLKSHLVLSRLMIIVTLICFIFFIQYFYHFNLTNIQFNFLGNKRENNSIDLNNHSDVLLVYVYANSHRYAYENLKYFIKNAVRENDGVDYFIILQQIENKLINESEMPRLPLFNGYYIQHENKCFDYGTIGWFFNEYTQGNPWINSNQTINRYPNVKVILSEYKYFIFMNSSVRGPFFPPYFLKFLFDNKKIFNWSNIFTKRLNEKIKLVGCTIGCYIVPHVQSYFLVTDFIGLTILLKPGSQGGTLHGIFACYSSKEETIQNAEFSISNRILEAGYKIDSFVVKDQNIDFLEIKNRGCSPNTINIGADWATVEPYEVVFVKYKERENVLIPHYKAHLYQKWMEDINHTNGSSSKSVLIYIKIVILIHRSPKTK